MNPNQLKKIVKRLLDECDSRSPDVVGLIEGMGVSWDGNDELDQIIDSINESGSPCAGFIVQCLERFRE